MLIIFICRTLLLSFAFMGCSWGNRDGNVPAERGHAVYRTKTDWIVDRDHQLDYPIGVDTVAWWEKGRYEIVYDALYDNSLKWPDYVLMDGVEGYFREDGKIFFWGNGQYGVLDLDNDVFSLCSENEIPKDYRTQGCRIPPFTPVPPKQMSR